MNGVEVDENHGVEWNDIESNGMESSGIESME